MTHTPSPDSSTIDTSQLFEPKGKPQPPPTIGFFESNETTDQAGPDEMFQSAMKAAKTARNTQDMADVLRQLTTAADRGHVRAAFQLGRIYELGIGVPCQQERAFGWYRFAAERGDESAQQRLRDLLGEGAECPYTSDDPAVVSSVRARRPKPDYSTHEAEFNDWLLEVLADWWEGLANVEVPWASYEFARVLLLGHGRDENLKEAASRFRKAADLGHLEAMRELAELLRDGTLPPESEGEARVWMTRAAETGGRLNDMLMLGDWFRDGIGGAVDLAQAARWYRRAAEIGLEAERRLDETGHPL